MLTLPKQFQLGAHTWTVEHAQGTFDVDGDTCNGVCDFSSLTIKVNVAMPDSLVMHSFMHEVMHAILWTVGHPLATDEGFVDATGCALAQVLQSSV